MEVKVTYDGLRHIFELIKEKYTVISPVLKEGVIQLDSIEALEQLPSGYTQIEEKNFYSVKRSGEGIFSYQRPVLPFKRFINPPEFTFLVAKEENGEIKFEQKLPEKKLAFFDIKPCDLKAICILDDVFLNKNNHPDIYYKKARENIFIVAVTCFHPSDVCFCTSMGLSLKPEKGFDILITEIEDYFIVESGTKNGEEILKKIEGEELTEKDREKIKDRIKETEEKIKRAVNTDNLAKLLYSKIEDPYWKEIGERCLACTSCTQLCPTCFCFDIVEKNDPVNKISERIRVYDSCFSPTFATVHKFNIRQSIASRYRQWLMHKFAYWTDQFGEFGCVGCGRCITWCPASIDLTEEISRFRENDC
ncbi:4Fe-4S dicluster containing protein [Persephonella hydrogeniphila]|uniref:4Fe-4S dicluster containing protein n=1 Tax=Persephonella hydrogeniphila TaxID=198703 RepID=A0A285NDF7_9AQUI|nr:4Fe-4S dicluster domain-containing protein [Persephonella hydrogeniphila]SNZ06933.1 4Fe-4S dicluster containing protein [Persephonella hydrogeniphila]